MSWTPNLVVIDTENAIAAKDAIMIVGDGNASHAAESDYPISSRDNDKGKKEEQHAKIADDAVQNYSSSNEARQDDPSELLYS